MGLLRTAGATMLNEPLAATNPKPSIFSPHNSHLYAALKVFLYRLNHVEIHVEKAYLMDYYQNVKRKIRRCSGALTRSSPPPT